MDRHIAAEKGSPVNSTATIHANTGAKLCVVAHVSVVSDPDMRIDEHMASEARMRCDHGIRPDVTAFVDGCVSRNDRRRINQSRRAPISLPEQFRNPLALHIPTDRTVKHALTQI